MLGERIRNSNDGSNGCDIGNRRWSSATSVCIAGMMWPPPVAPEVPKVTVKAMMPWAFPAIGISMGVVIIHPRLKSWVGLGGQRA